MSLFQSNASASSTFYNYMEPKKPGRNYGTHMQINPNFDNDNHIQKTYVSPERRSPDSR